MKFLVTGLGSIGLRHAKNLIALGHEVYGEDIDDHKVFVAGKTHYIPRFTGYDLPFIEANIICSPTSEHAKHLVYATSMGWHVLVEKPIASEMYEFLAMSLAVAKKKDLVVMVGNNLRFRGCVRQVKNWLSGKIEEADIGQVRCAMFTLAQRNTKYTDHVISNWGAHELDLARYLLGPCEVEACGGDREVADVILWHDNGCQTVVHLDYIACPETREFLIVGTKGCIACDLVAGIARFEVGSFRGIETFRDTLDDNYVEEMQDFIAQINGAPPTVGATGADGLATLKLISVAREMAGG